MYEIRSFNGTWDLMAVTRKLDEAIKILESYQKSCPWARFTLRRVGKDSVETLKVVKTVKVVRR